MRWFVEVSPSGVGVGGSRYCLEGKQWQLALQEVRKALGDTGPLSKLTIELMDGGYRALNPSTKARYTVKKAPDDAALKAPEGAAVSVPDSAASKAPEVSAPDSAASKAPEAPAPTVSAPDESASKAPEVAVSEAPASPGLDHHLIRAREEEPTAQTPITYREYAYAVRPGTPLPAVRELILERFGATKRALGGAPPGQFVQLAVFDYVYEVRPTAPPLVTLAWKDWRGAPVLQYPASGAPAETLEERAEPPVAEPPAVEPPAVEPPTAVEEPAAAAGAPSEEDATTIPVTVDEEDATTIPVTVDEEDAEAAEPPVAEPPAAEPPEAPAPEAPEPEAPPASIVVTPAPASVPAPTPAMTIIVAEDVPEPAPIAVPADVKPSPAAAHAKAESAKPGGSKKSSVKRPTKRSLGETTHPDTPSQKQRVVSQRRADGEELISELFETMHELHFMPDLVSGCEFTLDVLKRSIPSEGVLLQIYDINRREFVVVRAEGKAPRDSLLHRTPDSDALLKDILRAPRARRFAEASALDAPRWRALQTTPKSALVGPVRQGGRYLGVVELCNPEGGGEYFDTEVNALDYICEQLAEFVAGRPVVLDPDVVLPERR